MNLLNLDDEKYKTVSVQGFNFKIKFISPLDRVKITQRRMNLQDGKSVEALTRDEFYYFENIGIVDVCTDELPKDFPYNKNDSCLKWDDITLINELAEKIRKHTSDIEEALKKNKPV
jgi:hypothetical protein